MTAFVEQRPRITSLATQAAIEAYGAFEIDGPGGGRCVVIVACKCNPSEEPVTIVAPLEVAAEWARLVLDLVRTEQRKAKARDGEKASP